MVTKRHLIGLVGLVAFGLFVAATTRIENLPGYRAKKVYRVVSANEIEETFYPHRLAAFIGWSLRLRQIDLVVIR